jgi:hypothetical protein
MEAPKKKSKKAKHGIPRIIRAAHGLIPSHSRAFQDSTQTLVESMFVEHKTPAQVAAALFLTPEEAERRYMQVLRQYMRAADNMTDEWAKVEILRLLQGAKERREDLQNQIVHAKAKGGEFPRHQYSAIDSTDKLIYKIYSDFVRGGLKNSKQGKVQSGVPRGPEEAQDAKMRAEADRRMKQVDAQYRVLQEEESELSDSVEEDLSQALGIAGDMFGEA